MSWMATSSLGIASGSAYWATLQKNQEEVLGVSVTVADEPELAEIPDVRPLGEPGVPMPDQWTELRASLDSGRRKGGRRGASEPPEGQLALF